MQTEYHNEIAYQEKKHHHPRSGWSVIMGWGHISSVFEGYMPPEDRVELNASGTKSKLVKVKKSFAPAVRNQNIRVEVDLAEYK